MAAAEKLDRGYLGRLLQLTLLAPAIVEAIVEGRQKEGMSSAVLMQGVPMDWAAQSSCAEWHPRPRGAGCKDPSLVSTAKANGRALLDARRRSMAAASSAHIASQPR